MINIFLILAALTIYIWGATIKKYLNWVSNEHYRLFLVAALVWGGAMYFLNNHYKIDLPNIIVEANGMLFDLIVFGVLLSFYDYQKTREQKIEHEKNIIDDFRGWDSQEGVLRTVGAIKRLNKLGETNLNLRGCFLQKARLEDVNLKGAKLEYARLEGAFLDYAHLEGAKLISAHLEGATLTGTELKGADLFWAHLDGAHVGQHWFADLGGLTGLSKEYVLERYSIDINGQLDLKNKT